MLPGPSPCWVVGMVQMMGKTLRDGFGVKGCIRHKEPLLDVQAALGRWVTWLCDRCTALDGQPVQ